MDLCAGRRVRILDDDADKVAQETDQPCAAGDCRVKAGVADARVERKLREVASFVLKCLGRTASGRQNGSVGCVPSCFAHVVNQQNAGGVGVLIRQPQALIPLVCGDEPLPEQQKAHDQRHKRAKTNDVSATF